MKTWNQFLEAKAQLAPMSQQPPEYQPGYTPPSARRSATLNLTPAQRVQGQAQQAATQGPNYGTPASDEDMGSQYAKSMQIQQARAAAQMGRRV